MFVVYLIRICYVQLNHVGRTFKVHAMHVKIEILNHG